MARKVDIGPRIGIDGEAEYRRQMQAVNASLSKLAAEAKVVASEFAGQERSTEALSAKSDVLERQLIELQSALSQQEEMLVRVGREFGEDSTETLRYSEAVAKTTEKINGIRKQLEDANDQIRENTDATGKLTAEIEAQERELADLQRAYSNTVLESGKNSKEAKNLQEKIKNLNGSLEENRKKLNDAGDAMEETQEDASNLSSFFSGTMQVAVGNLAAQGFALLIDAAKKAAGALKEVVTESAAYADDILTMASKTGIGVQTLQEFSYMAELVDVDMDTLQGSLSRLTREMASAQEPVGGARAALESLGISATDSAGNVKAANALFSEAYNVLANLEDSWEANAISSRLFGGTLAEVSGQQMAGLNVAAATLSDRLKESDSSASGAATAFQRLGVSTTDSNGNLRDSYSVFLDVIDALGAIQNQTERDALSMQIFGRSAQDLNPLIDAGRQKIAEYADEARKMGYVLEDEQVAALGQVDDELKRLEKAWEATKLQLAAELAPTVIDLAQRFRELVGDMDIKEVASDVGAIIEDLSAAIMALAGNLEVVGKVARYFLEPFYLFKQAGKAVGDWLTGGEKMAAQLSAPNYNQQATNTALTHAAQAQQRLAASGLSPQQVQVSVGYRRGAEQTLYATVNSEAMRQGGYF